jgi:uncharacterized membrane-anchored protein
MRKSATWICLLAVSAFAFAPISAQADGPDELSRTQPAVTPPVTPPPSPAARPAAAPTTPTTTTPAPTTPAAPTPAAPVATPTATPAGPEGRSGVIALPAGDLSLNVPTSFSFFGPDVARAHLARVGAPLPAGELLGLLAPRGSSLDSPGFWGSVVSYQPIGHVSADTASGLSDGGFERSVRDARAAAGRAFEGFESNPSYTPTATALSWVERSARPSRTAQTVRYEQRLLGRNGVAAQTIVAREDQLGEIKASAPSMLSMMSFAPGQRYGDYVQASDAASSYTVPGLVTNLPTASPVGEVASVAGGTGAQSAKSAPAGAPQTNYLPWLLGGLALVGGLGWLALGNRGRRDDDDRIYTEDDPNIQPKKDD